MSFRDDGEVHVPGGMHPEQTPGLRVLALGTSSTGSSCASLQHLHKQVKVSLVCQPLEQINGAQARGWEDPSIHSQSVRSTGTVWIPGAEAGAV